MKTLDELRADLAATQKAIAEAEEAERIANMRGEGLSLIAKVAAFKALFLDLAAKPDILNEAWKGIPPQALPRERLVGKRYGLSETEEAVAKKKGRDAVMGL
jgi:hypothetical protein